MSLVHTAIGEPDNYGDDNDHYDDHRNKPMLIIFIFHLKPIIFAFWINTSFWQKCI